MKVFNYTVYLQKAEEGGYIASLKKHGEKVPSEVGEVKKVAISV